MSNKIETLRGLVNRNGKTPNTEKTEFFLGKKLKIEHRAAICSLAKVSESVDNAQLFEIIFDGWLASLEQNAE